MRTLLVGEASVLLSSVWDLARHLSLLGLFLWPTLPSKTIEIALLGFGLVVFHLSNFMFCRKFYLMVVGGHQCFGYPQGQLDDGVVG